MNRKSHPLLGEGSITVTNLICRPGALSIIPDECEISIDRRYMPDESIQELLEGFQALFAEITAGDPEFKATVEVRKIRETSYTGYTKEVKKYHPPWITDETNRYVRTILGGLKRANQSPNIRYWKFGTDGSYTAGLMGLPTIGYSGMEEGLAHTPEEMVNCDKMKRSLEGYYAILRELYDV
jgi:acetylornithine deacetylase/succinyl-diaminopimelate desuccinylase-like protein